jgi:hypothetical protein
MHIFLGISTIVNSFDNGYKWVLGGTKCHIKDDTELHLKSYCVTDSIKPFLILCFFEVPSLSEWQEEEACPK